MCKELDLKCKKCGAAMPPVPRPKKTGGLNSAAFCVTGWICQTCGKWNRVEREEKT
jgi:hypothetical protein